MFSFTNTNELRELAIYYQKNKQYPYYDEYLSLYEELNKGRKKGDSELFPSLGMMSYTAQEFARHWVRLFCKGTTIGGVPYSGEHLFYLNAVKIERTINLDEGVFKNKTKKARAVGGRDFGFPDFWDEDYKYFMTCDIARSGLEKRKLVDQDGNFIESNTECYNRLFGNTGFDLGLVIDEDNLDGGLNHIYLKPRGVGFSWKIANFNNHNLFLTPNTHNFIFAATSEYLGDKDGAMAKFVKLRSFIQSECWFLRKSFYKQSISENSFATGYKVNAGGAEVIRGFNSSVNGVIIDGDTAKARGKRGNGSFEEFGSFPGVDKVWEVFDSSMTEYGTVFGQARGGGTGGDTAEGYEALEKMFYNPKTYRTIRFKNPFESNYRGIGVGMFTPAYININNKDKDGNSDQVTAKEDLDKQRELKRQAADGSVYIQFCAEKPYEPNEAFSARGKNILPIKLAKEVLSILDRTNKDRSLCRYGDFEYLSSGVKFISDPLAKPYEGFPVGAGDDTEGCVVILKEPYKVNGKVPDNLYLISVDPYSDEIAVDSRSVGSFCVEENINTLTQAKGDIEVCWYDGRPEGYDGQNRFCKRLFAAAEYYNAKIVLENNEKGNVVHYARTHKDSKGRKLTEYLHEQLALGYDKRIATKDNMKREYGIHMTTQRKLQGLIDYKEYLETPRGIRIEPDGSETHLMNIHYIYNRGLLREIIAFKGDNADRISARIVKMFARQEFEDKNRKIGIAKVKQDSFFSQPLFQ